MPALSPTMEEGTLAKWFVKPGDKVRSGDVIAEIETDKATMEVEAVDEGEVAEILVAEGTEEVKVNTPIARLKGEGVAAAPTAKQDDQPKPLPPRGEGVGDGGASSVSPTRSDTPTPGPSPQGGGKRPRQRRSLDPRRPIPTSRPGPSSSASRSATRCAMRWPRRCGAIRASS